MAENEDALRINRPLPTWWQGELRNAVLCEAQLRGHEHSEVQLRNEGKVPWRRI
jgi:hypothetical protein